MTCLRYFSISEQTAIAPVMLADLFDALTANWFSVTGLRVPLLLNVLNLGGVA